MSDPRIIVALDFDDERSALALARQLDPAQCRLKVGKALFTRLGPGLVEKLNALGFDVFLDLKYHDIPNTVAGACRAAAGLGVWMLNVHVLGGRAMLQAAKEALEGAGDRPRLIGVTILTSLEEAGIEEVGLRGPVVDEVVRLASLAADCGLDGVVCSPHELRVLRKVGKPGFVLVTPGIRPNRTDKHDQSRTMTPSEAFAAGADYLVVGRPITRAVDPIGALAEIAAQIDRE